MAYNILIVTPFYYEPPRHKIGVMELSLALSRQTKVTVISSLIEGAKAFEQQGNLAIYRFRPWWYLPSIPYLMDPLLGRKIIQVARQEEADIIVAVTVEFWSSFMAALAKGTLKIPLAVWIRGDRATFHNSALNLLFQLYDNILGRFVVYRADSLFCQTNLMRERARKLGAANEKIVVSPSGIDTSRFSPGLDASAVRQEFGISEGTKVVIFVGNLFPRKGIQYLLEASKTILEQHADVLFMIVGAGPLEQELKASAQQIAPGKFLFTGFRRDIPFLLNLAKVLVLPSLREGLPQTILEAYACGVPVVATDVGGVKDILNAGEHGFIVPPRDPAAIAQAVNRILSDEALQRSISANNRETAVRLYDLDKVASETLQKMQTLSLSIAARRQQLGD